MNKDKTRDYADVLRERDATDPVWQAMTMEEKSRVMNQDIYDCKSEEWKNDVQERFIRWDRNEQKTERISFRCTPVTRRLIESIGQQCGTTLSQTMEFIIACFFNETDPPKEEDAKK